jgi:RNA 2',3'-cyclic 3'-phosphodiesterase
VSNNSSARRLFFALWPSSAEQDAFEQLMRPYVLASGGRAIPARNLHVTLAFLGQVPESKLEVVKQCADAVGSCGRIDLQFHRVEVWKRSRVLSLVPLATPPELSALVQRLKFNLLSEQFETRQEEYRPHITLARDAKKRIDEALPNPIAWSTTQFVLVQSETTVSGSSYTVLHYWE